MSASAVQRLRGSFLPMSLPDVGEDAIAEVADTLRSDYLTGGPKVTHFEREFAAFTGAEHAIAVNSSSAALHLSLLALGIGPGDEVILPALPSGPTANIVAKLGASPIRVDVDESMLIDPDAAESVITARTRLILPVHYGGQASDMDAVCHLARRYGLFVVENGAQSAGTKFRGVRVGTHGDAVAFSFNGGSIDTGNGGMITTNDVDLAVRIQRLIDGGVEDRMTELTASLAIHRLRNIESSIARRQQIAQQYAAGFCGRLEVEMPLHVLDTDHACSAFPIFLTLDRMLIGTSRFIEELRAARIGATGVDQSFEAPRGKFNVAERMAGRVIFLPIYPRMTPNDVEDVVDAVCTTVRGHRQ